MPKFPFTTQQWGKLGLRLLRSLADAQRLAQVMPSMGTAKQEACEYAGRALHMEMI